MSFKHRDSCRGYELKLSLVTDVDVSMFYGFNVDVNMAKQAEITTGLLTAAPGAGDAALQHNNQAFYQSNKC